MRWALLFCSVATTTAAADASVPHSHTGLLTKYQAVKPDQYGISLAGATADDLRQGRPVMRVIEGKGGFKRAVSIQVRGRAARSHCTPPRPFADVPPCCRQDIHVVRTWYGASQQ